MEKTDQEKMDYAQQINYGDHWLKRITRFLYKWLWCSWLHNTKKYFWCLWIHRKHICWIGPYVGNPYFWHCDKCHPCGPKDDAKEQIYNDAGKCIGHKE